MYAEKVGENAYTHKYTRKSMPSTYMASKASQIGERLKAAREKAGISQAEAGRRLSVDTQTVSRWERGAQRIRAENLIALSELYGADISSFVGGSINGHGDVERATFTPKRLSEPRSGGYAEVAFSTPRSTQEGRVWLEQFLLELADEGADEDFLAWTRRFLTNPQNFALYADGNRTEMTDEQKLRHLQGLAAGVRNILKDRQRKAKAK